MTALPVSTDFTGASVTEAQFKTAITALRDYLSGQFGSAGDVSTALATLGALGGATVDKTTAYTVAATDRGKLITCSGTFTLSLTAAATLASGFSFMVKNTGTGVITIDPNSTELIDGYSTLVLFAGEAASILCTGTAFQTVGKSGETPPGTVMHSAAISPPAGWLEANGALVSRTTYARLFAAIGTTFGAGDGTTTFGLPDLRGEFIRGYDNGRGVDSARVFGSAQVHQMQSHSHTFTGGTSGSGTGGWAFDTNSTTKNTSATGGTTNGSENRPRNIALLTIIKF